MPTYSGFRRFSDLFLVWKMKYYILSTGLGWVVSHLIEFVAST